MSDIKKAIFVDGSGYIFRAYHGLRPLNRPDGTPVNAVYGFTQMLWRLLDDHQADLLAVIFDKGRKTFRNEIYPQYKAHRPPAPEDLIPQFPLIREAVRAFNVPCIEMENYEADDLIATYARLAEDEGYSVTIISGDKDLMQLVRPGVILKDPMKNKNIGTEQVQEKFGVKPERVVDVQALAGDSTDNIPGVPGIGIKTAAQLIDTYGNLESLLANAHQIKQPKRRQSLEENANLARISMQLVTLKEDVPIAEPLENLKWLEPEQEALKAFFLEQGFRSLIARLPEVFGTDANSDYEDEAPSLGNCEYVCVQDMETLDIWIEKAFAAGHVAVDTETDSLNAVEASVVGISLAIEAGHACYIPLRHRLSSGLALENGGIIKQLDPVDVFSRLRELFRSPSVLKILHNAKYDIMVLQNEDVELFPVDDTMLLSYVLDAGKGERHGLDALAMAHFSHKTIAYKEVAGVGKAQVTFDLVSLDKATHYAAEDADICLRLWEVLKPRLAQEKMTFVYENIERPLVDVIAYMERAGIKVDREALARLSNDFATRSAALEREIYEEAGQPFNIASPKQLGEILFGKMGLPGGKKTKTGAYSTSVDILDGLAAKGHTLPQKIVAWRQFNKLKATYSDALQECILKSTGRVHTSYAMATASTGRLSSSDPNLQNIPIRTDEGRKIRNTFVAEAGNKLVSIDYSQIELRIVAHVAGDSALLEAFKRGADIHAATAAQMFEVPLEGMDPMVRRKAKAINFGVIYGISSFGLANNLGIAQSEAKAFIDSYFERFPGVAAYMSDIKERARKQGYVETLFGRRIYTPFINDKNYNNRGFAERQAINAPIQGTAADIIKRAMVRMPGALDGEGLKAKMLLQVHDELVFEVLEEEVESLIKLAKSIMEHAPDPVLSLDIPLVADAGFGENWGEAH